MKRIIFITLSTLCLEGVFCTANAQEMLLVKSDECIRLAEHIPNDVNYKAGVDVKGRSVKPADIASNDAMEELNDRLKNQISFHLVYDTAKYTKSRLNGLKQEMVIGFVEIRKDGVVYFNDKPLAPTQTSQIHLLCKKKKKK